MGSTGRNTASNAGNVKEPAGLDSSIISNFISERGLNRGRALTTLDSKNLGEQLDNNAKIGDTLITHENGRSVDITKSYEKEADGWHYRRRNESTGELYEDSIESARTVASDILSTQGTPEPEYWSVRRR